MTSLKKVNSTDLTPLPVPVLPTAVTEEPPTTVKQGYNDSNNDLNTCVVCFKTVDIYSIGECDHPVCYECSARMRVLCRQNECPICRRELSQVIFTNIILPYRQLEINNRSGLYDKKYRVCFSSQYIQKSFNKLLDNSCPKCNAHGFHKFSDLKDHVRREHELFYCDICTDNLRIFSFERKCYNRQELGLHRRKGDPDNTSHRGHPLCQFCDCRYLDRDELFRHLRRNHFFCHLCDLDGCNQFYGCYDTLREHFRNEHYLCEEGDCFYEKLTAVFRSEIDLKAHMSKQHSKSLGKVATRQARTLELEFTLAPRNRSGQGGGGGNREGGSGGDQRGGRNRLHNYNQNNNYNNEQQNENDIMVMDNVYNVGNQNNSNNNNNTNNNNNYSHSMNNEQNTIGNEIVQNVNRKKVIDAQNEQEFPSLGGPSGNTNSGGNTTAVTLVRPNLSIRTKTYGPANLVKTKENFPALGSSDSSGTASPNFMSNNSNSNGGHYSQGSASALLKKPNVKSNQTKKPQSGMVIHVSNRPKSKHMDSDFPALPGSANSNSNHTITQSTKQQNQNRYALAADMDALPKTQGQQNLLLNMNAIAAKHRSLVDEYVPMSSSYNAKLTLINSTQQKPQLTQQQQQINDSFNAEPPRLNSKNNFPSLGGGNSRNNSAINNSLPQQWIMTSSTSSSEAKQQMKKTKPTPPPSFNLNDYKTNLPSNNNKKQNNNVLNKTSKDVAGTTSILTTGGGNNNKKEKKKNNEKKENNNNNSNVTNNNNKNIIKTNNNKKEKFNNNNNNLNENDIKAVTATVTPETKKIQVQEQKTIINNKNNQKSSSSQHQVQMKNLKINDENSFPALGEMTNFYNSNITDKPSPAMIKPPPGFDNSNQNVVPPPGFNSVTLNSVARAPSNNLTFTNSLGESYSILPQHYYKPPTNSVKRNQVLVQHFQDALNSIEAMEQFRQISQMFRDGDYMALPYYEHCRIALNSKFDEIFPELLTLLPDISKQQELYLVHSQYIKDNITDVKKRTMQQSLLDVCETCKQVLRAIDLQSHMQTHTLENNFPTLGGSSSSSSVATTNSTSGGTNNNINQQKQSAQSAWKK